MSYTIAFGALHALLPRDRSGIATSLVILRFGLVALMAVLCGAETEAVRGGASEAVNALLGVVPLATP